MSLKKKGTGERVTDGRMLGSLCASSWFTGSSLMSFLDTDVPKGDLARLSPTKSMVTLSFSLVHVSWIFLFIGSDEDILKKKA